MATMDLAKHTLDPVAMRVAIPLPVLHRVLAMRATPAPLLLDLEQIGRSPDQMMARHHAAGEERLCDSVLHVGAVEQVGSPAITIGSDTAMAAR